MIIMARSKSSFRRLFTPTMATAALTYSTFLYQPSVAFSHAGNYGSTSNTRRFSTNEKETILEATGEWSDVLPMVKGSHNSARIEVPATEETTDVFDASTFRDRLEASITACRELGKTSLWLEVPMSRARLIEDMGEFGIRFHHAVDDRAILNLWLRDDESKIPDFATHNVGVGAFVVNSRGEILCVRELRKNYMPWKTPTGLSELGEQLDEAVEREVFEETGIRAKFHSVLSFRQTHGLTHGRSDLFFVCRLDPVEEVDESGKPVIPEPVPQENEIAVAQWVPLSEYRDMVNGKDGSQGHPMMKHVVDVYDAEKHIERTVVNSIVPGRKPNAIYYPAIERLGQEDKN